jgi:hypothetical protein
MENLACGEDDQYSEKVRDDREGGERIHDMNYREDGYKLVGA